MKTRLMLISIFVLLFGSSLCMAKTTVLVTPTVNAAATDTVECNFINGGDTDVAVQVEFMDWGGTVIYNSTLGISPDRGIYITHVGEDIHYFCRFTYTGKHKSLRGMIVVSNTSTGVIHASIPAN